VNVFSGSVSSADIDDALIAIDSNIYLAGLAVYVDDSAVLLAHHSPELIGFHEGIATFISSRTRGSIDSGSASGCESYIQERMPTS
jgi:hypothetical protein